MQPGKYARFGAALDRCQSPIERRFAHALLFAERSTFEPSGDEVPWHIAVNAIGVVLGQQVPVGDYFVDFTFTHPDSSHRYAIELDGHEWHEKTREQAARDRQRERVITAHGWTVVRFTGSEVTRAPLSCAREAYRIMTSRVSGARVDHGGKAVVETRAADRPAA